MLQPDAIATPAGKPAPRIVKRPTDDRAYSIDCAPLLRPHELLAGVTACDAPSLPGTTARTRLGRFVELRVGASEAPPATMPHKDHGVTLTVRTSQGAVAVAVDIRVTR